MEGIAEIILQLNCSLAICFGFKQVDGFAENLTEIRTVDFVDMQQIRSRVFHSRRCGVHQEARHWCELESESSLSLHRSQSADKSLIGGVGVELNRLAVPAVLIGEQIRRHLRLSRTGRSLQNDEMPLTQDFFHPGRLGYRHQVIKPFRPDSLTVG